MGAQGTVHVHTALLCVAEADFTPHSLLRVCGVGPLDGVFFLPRCGHSSAVPAAVHNLRCHRP